MMKDSMSYLLDIKIKLNVAGRQATEGEEVIKTRDIVLYYF
jgi:hypothetical protein